MRSKKVRNISIITALVNIVLGFVKILTGAVVNSQSLFVDGIHSLTDFVTDFFVIVMNKYSSAQPDREHPYGHQRIETIGVVVLGLILIVTGLSFFYKSYQLYLNETTYKRLSDWAIVIALLSIVTNEVLFHWSKRVAESINSKLLLSNAWHHRSDSLSSLVVLIGILFHQAGFDKAEMVSSAIVAIMITKMGWDFARESLFELVDTAMDLSLEKKVREAILSIEEVRGINQLRSRKVGHEIFVDLNIIVDSNISVTEGHQISLWVKKNIKSLSKEIKDVVVHIDTTSEVNLKELLPLRSRVLEDFYQMQDIITPNLVDHILIHYLDDMIALDIRLKAENEIMFTEQNRNDLLGKLDQKSQVYQYQFSIVK